MNCHNRMDHIGFGLEKFDAFGKYREVEKEHEECVIDGAGDTVNHGTFSGPRELGALAVESQRIEVCLVKRFAELSVGRVINEDDTAIQALINNFRLNPDFKNFLIEFVMSDGFRHRYE